VQYRPPLRAGIRSQLFHGTGRTPASPARGGLTSLNHGYSTVGDLGLRRHNGLVYFATPRPHAEVVRSEPQEASANATCNLTRTPTPVLPTRTASEPIQPGLGPEHHLGGAGSRQAGLERPDERPGPRRLARRSVRPRSSTKLHLARDREICPTGTFSQADIDRIAAAARPRTTSGSSSPK